MRLIILLLCAVLILPSVLGVGIGLPQDLEDVVNVDQGDDWTYTFLLRGDAEEQDVQFYAITSRDGVVEVNGDDDGYTKNYNLDPYEDVYIDVDFEAVGDGRISVIWGFKYLGSGNPDDGFSFEQAMEKSFIVDVDGDTNNNDVDVRVNTNDDDTDTTTPIAGAAGGAGGGGAGGGAALLGALEDGSPESISGGDSGANLEDISAQGSATSEMVGQEDPKAKTGILESARNALSGAGTAVGDSVQGKGVLIVLLAFLIAGMVVSLYAARIAKEDAL